MTFRTSLVFLRVHETGQKPNGKKKVVKMLEKLKRKITGTLFVLTVVNGDIWEYLRTYFSSTWKPTFLWKVESKRGDHRKVRGLCFTRPAERDLPSGTFV